MKVIGYHVSSNGVMVNTDNDDFEGGDMCLEDLLRPKEDSIRIFYHLEYGVANLLRMARISHTAGRELLYTTSLNIRPYKLRYVQGKFFSIKRSGTFSYFSNAGQYTNFPNEWLLKDARELAEKAKEVGHRALDALKELGIDATSLTNPYKAYEKMPGPELVRLMEKETDEIKRNVMRKIALGIIERDLATNPQDGPAPITLAIAIKENKWDDLGKLNQRRKG